MLPHIITTNTTQETTIMTIYTGKKVIVITSTNPHWEKAKTALNNSDITALEEIAMSKGEKIAKTAPEPFELKNGEFLHDGKPVSQLIQNRVEKMLNDNMPTDHFKALSQFIYNLAKNPSMRVVDLLYNFINANNLPLTRDGCFLAYKWVTNSFRDCYTGAINNQPGATVSVPRNSVLDDPNVTCSFGLHACSLAYLQHYTGDKLVLVKINPKDVVSVPYDYNGSKLRCCRYKVIRELDIGTIEELDATWKPSTSVDDDVDHSESNSYEDNKDENSYESDE